MATNNLSAKSADFNGGMIAWNRMSDLTTEEKTAIRHRIFERSGGYCEVTGQRIYWKTFHLSHEKSRGSGGEWSEENLMARSPESHSVEKHNPKSVRSKK